MNDREFEDLADSVIAAYALRTPVDLVKIANEEGLQLLEGDFGPEFHGRIEYLPEERVFAIYHPSERTGVAKSRIRFTVAHEFGHFFIPTHRERLVCNLVHDSEDGFRSTREIERQANRFAASLLVPSELLRRRIGRRGSLDLRGITAIAAECETSLQSAAFRYTQFTEEPHAAIVSEAGKVLYSFASDEAVAIGLRFTSGTIVPENSPTALAVGDAHRTIRDGRSSTDAWLPERLGRADLWEEATSLGYGGLVLTLVSLD